MDIDLEKIRRVAITAIFADDYLLNQLALKGGNALSLVHRIGSRTSLDVDVSLEKDIDDFTKTQERISRMLADRFRSENLQVFDIRMKRVPEIREGHYLEKQSGYSIEFKLLPFSRSKLVEEDLPKAQREALVVGLAQERKFSIQISKYEYIQGKQESQIDGFTIFVYSPAMIAVEKFRAICQQMAEYPFRSNPVPRARDFYDIHAICSEAKVDSAVAENLELFRAIFGAKDVPLALIANIPSQREYHRPDWPRVEAAVSGDLKDFDYYFGFVASQIPHLKVLWDEQSPF